MKYSTQLLVAMADAIAPRYCSGCRGVLMPVEKHLCTTCSDRLRWRPNGYSPGLPLFDRVRVGLSFDVGPVQSLVHAGKYNGQKELFRYLGQCMAHSMDPLPLDTLLIPVPLTALKMQRRGYNQSHWIAMGLSDIWECPVLERALYRTSQKKSQTSLSKTERRRNTEGVFALSPLGIPPLSESRIALVDDTLTTGATLQSCALALRLWKPARLEALALAWAE